MTTWLARLLPFLRAPDVAFFHRFMAPPYGGANQFLLALRKTFEQRGLVVGANTIGNATRAALLNAFAFEVPRLRQARRQQCRVVHRVDGPVGRYRGQDDSIDRTVLEINQEFASATIFQSNYSRQALEEMGLRFHSPVVIPNAVDDSIFYPRVTSPDRRGGRIRLISTSWSDNPNKGADVYQWLDEHLDWTRFDYTFIGRSPVKFDRIRTLAPLSSRPLADELRAHDVYVTASRNDSCSNALLEALACGLPALAIRSGGNPELVQDGGALFDGTDDVLDRLAELEANYQEKQSRIQLVSLAEVADRYLSVLLPAAGSDPDQSRAGGS